LAPWEGYNHLTPTFTGCGTGGGNSTIENVSVTHSPTSSGWRSAPQSISVSVPSEVYYNLHSLQNRSGPDAQNVLIVTSQDLITSL
jgi:hypothetical protein